MKLDDYVIVITVELRRVSHNKPQRTVIAFCLLQLTKCYGEPNCFSITCNVLILGIFYDVATPCVRQFYVPTLFQRKIAILYTIYNLITIQAMHFSVLQGQLNCNCHVLNSVNCFKITQSVNTILMAKYYVICRGHNSKNTGEYLKIHMR